jgi:L-threonylcarbamoyladenylate synthase
MPPPTDDVRRAVEALRAGEVVAFPTETVYGLGADALREGAVERVFALKGRPRNNPMIVHVADEAMARTVVASWTERASRLVSGFWPGALTLVLEKADAVPALVTAGHRSVGVRCPDHPIALELIRAFGRPIVGPSANPSGRVSPTTAAHVREGFPGGGLTVLEGGPCRAGIESTVLSLVHEPARILRPGAVAREDLEAALGAHIEIVGQGVAGEEGAGMLAPGRLASHYAPRAPTRLFDARDWPGVIGAAPARTVVITHEPARLGEGGMRFVRLPEGAGPYAAGLYAALREADALDPGLILIERPEGRGGLWTAIHDRLERAAAPRE